MDVGGEYYIPQIGDYIGSSILLSSFWNKNVYTIGWKLHTSDFETISQMTSFNLKKCQRRHFFSEMLSAIICFKINGNLKSHRERLGRKIKSYMSTQGMYKNRVKNDRIFFEIPALLFS